VTYQTLQTLSQLAIAVGVTLSALGGYGSYYFQKQIDNDKERALRPVVDLCHRGISVTPVDNDKLYFDIPYCSGKNANAHNVKLQTAVIKKDSGGFRVLMPFGDDFPDNITLTYETGKSMLFSLQPLTCDSLVDIYIGVRGTYTNETGATTYPVLDVFKFNAVAKNWVRTLGAEDKQVRNFLVSM
jgi:hypothetical protein